MASIRRCRRVKVSITVAENIAEHDVVRAVVGFFSDGDLVGPELGFDSAKTAQLPIGLDKSIDQKTLERICRLELLAIARGQGFEFGGIFAGNDLDRHGSLDSENTRRPSRELLMANLSG